MQKSIPAFLTLLVLVGGLAFVGMSASAKSSKSCKDGLVPGAYDCSYLVEGKTIPRPMTVWFSHFSGPEATGPEMYLTGPETGGAQIALCACAAKKPDPAKPGKIGFGAGKVLECMALTGSHYVGPENFDFGVASYRGEPKKGAFKNGQAVDANGNTMVFRCVNDD